jgi:dihydroorotate dehydrogenase electron transfer subunit
LREAGTRALPIRVDAEVASNRSEGGGAYRLALVVPGWPGSLPGQFVMLSPGPRGAVERSDPLLPRPMAVYRVRATVAGAELEVLYKVTGRGTALLAGALPGQRIRVVGPLGAPFPATPRGARALLVGGGTGIASLLDLAARGRDGGEVVVLLGARSRAELMGRDDFAALGIDLRLATEDGSAGAPGLVTELLERTLEEAPAARIYACGPTAMMRRCAEIAAERGLPCSVSLENHMACGFGVCLGCAAPVVEGGYSLVCRDGSVFEASRLRWEGLP